MHLDEGTVPFNFVDYQQNKLLVTLGDSWTWGDELDPTRRIQFGYGNLLAQNLQCDWLNLSVPGCGNHYIGVLFCEFIDYIVKNPGYQDITCVITLTEIGRDFNSWFDRNVDYATWLRENIRVPEDYDRLLEYQNKMVVDKIIEQANRVSNITIKFATNFVDPIGIDKKYMLKKSWLEILMSLDHVCYFTMPGIIDNLKGTLGMEWSLSEHTFKSWAEDQICRAIKRCTALEFLRDSESLLHKRFHPTEHAHSLWADYVALQLR